MLSLEQIRRLEQRVNEAVERINTLEREKRGLKEQLTESRAQATKLEARLEQQSKEQAAIERGILAALEQLDQLEHEISEDAQQVTQLAKSDLHDNSDDSFAAIEPETHRAQSVASPVDDIPPDTDTDEDAVHDSIDTATEEVQVEEQPVDPKKDQELDIF